MIRKLILPAVAIALLGGCMTGGYSYRQDRGDYYYGQPGVDYRYHGSPYGYYDRYGYPGYSRYGYGSHYGYGGYYGYPYSPYGGFPYYPYRPPVVIVKPPGNGEPPPPDSDNRGDRGGPPWRNLNRVGRTDGYPPPVPARTQRSEPPPPAVTRPRPDSNASNRQMIRRAPQAQSRDREIE